MTSYGLTDFVPSANAHALQGSETAELHGEHPWDVNDDQGTTEARHTRSRDVGRERSADTAATS